jgi:hypothetical protein
LFFTCLQLLENRWFYVFIQVFYAENDFWDGSEFVAKN